jgi:hypothetical protein
MNTKAKKTTAKAPKTQGSKSFALTKKHKSLILFALATTGVVSLYALANKDSITTGITETQIKTPVIARTELSKKSQIDIKLFDENADTVEQVQPATENEVTIVEKATEEKAELVKANDITALVKNITEIELAQVELKNQIAELSKATNATKIEELNKKVAKLESLNGNIGNLSKIFLAQQLVLLDNAFKVGGNQNIAIENILNFAKNVAKDEKVATKLTQLLQLTQQQAIITPQALLFYAQKLENIDLVKLETTTSEQLAQQDTFIEKVKALFKSFIVVRKTDEVTAEKQLWLDAVNNLQEAIIFTDFVKVEKILSDEKIKALGDKDLENFTKLFNTYLDQQLALQATLGSFIEGYKYDY